MEVVEKPTMKRLKHCYFITNEYGNCQLWYFVNHIVITYSVGQYGITLFVRLLNSNLFTIKSVAQSQSSGRVGRQGLRWKRLATVQLKNLKINKRWRSRRYRKKNTRIRPVPKPGPICLVEGDKGLVGFNKQNIGPIRLCWMN